MNQIPIGHALVTKIVDLWEQAIEIWLSGGVAMVAIAVVSFAMFALGLHIHLKLSAIGFAKVRETTWRRWIDHPNERKGPVGELLNFVTRGATLKETAASFEEVRATEAAPFDRELRVMKICVHTAPLLGLLGTVAGMLTTFSALSTGSGGDKTMELVAAGISEALITTETGLVIALAGVFFQYHLARKYERYKAFLDTVETVCAQGHYRRMRERKAA